MDPSEPRPAATVIIVRDSTSGLEVLLTKRPESMRVMAGATVFPGGAVSPADCDERWEAASRLSGHEAAVIVGKDEPRAALGAFVCAVREAFEEVGFPLDGRDRITRQDADDPTRFLENCLTAGVILPTDRLVFAGSSVTPLGAAVRFDVLFFAVRAPDGWEPHPDPSEVAECWWSSPARALTEFAERKLIMVPPTVAMLQRLDSYRSVDDALVSLRSRGADKRPDIFKIRVSPLFAAVISPNQGGMGPGTNTYIVGLGPTVVIDPAVDDPAYLDTVLELAGEIDSILITHRDPDHVGGARALAEAANAPVRAFGSGAAGGAAVMPINDGESVNVPGATLIALHTPGHSRDHLCFYMKETASLFAGDNILGEGTAVIAPPDGNMQQYLESLHRLLGFDIDRIYPGHWPSLSPGRDVIERYIADAAGM